MTDWIAYLHGIRRQEIERIFHKCPLQTFPVGLELGAGDGYQSFLLRRYVERLVATDWDVRLLLARRTERLDVCQCDAEAVADNFSPATFDLVFSSNVLEHLPKPGAALRGIYTVLKGDGLAVHIVPSPVWKLCHIFLFWPNKIVLRLCRLAAREVERTRREEMPASPPNNPKMPQQTAVCRRRFWPLPHGAYRGHLEELLAFRKVRWLMEFERAGFRVVRVIKGPVCSGYGLGWERLRRALERLGFTSEYVYIAVKQGWRSPYEHYFRADGQGALN